MKKIAAAALTATMLLAPAPPKVDALAACPKYEATLRAFAPPGGWSVSKMSYFAWRESRCTPTIVNRTGGDTGLLQVHPVNFAWLSAKFGVPVGQIRPWLKNPTNNVRAAAALCTYWRKAGSSCYQPWAT